MKDGIPLPFLLMVQESCSPEQLEQDLLSVKDVSLKNMSWHKRDQVHYVQVGVYIKDYSVHIVLYDHLKQLDYVIEIL